MAREVTKRRQRLETNLGLLLLLHGFGRVQLCATPQTAAPGSLSLGFSRQEHRSGVPFPSPNLGLGDPKSGA